MAYWKGYAVALVSLLTGASVVHFIYRPDLVSFKTWQLRVLRQVLLADYINDCTILTPADDTSPINRD